ncbi:uncharacterized protein LOC113276445 [Papaver somniferum]|uniref:uncharacterized protein LOC113276445 n=1 Tax=Papaver somniferum TaxID=3469 RepID=UPI000E6FBE4B|nr:uncharacterized protein LOC113276445 [Papaver somniferum]XP_026381832.1 uncharacterized protein LOC113276445 [Papaver somniferum]
MMDCLLVHMCASTGECPSCILSASGRVLDRGRLLELDRRYSILLAKIIRYFMEQRRYSYYIRNSSNLSISILTRGLIVLHVVVSMQNYYANSVHNLILQSGYGLKLLFAKLNISFFVEDGDSGDTRKLFVIISKQGVFQWAESVLQTSRETENGLPHELFEQFLARNVSFPTQMEEVQKGLIASISNAIQHLLNCTSKNVYELFHKVASSDSVGAAGVSERSHEPIDQIHPCRIWSFSDHTGSLNLRLGCELLFLLKTLHEESVMIYVEASKQNDQSHILSKRVIGIFLVPIFIHQSNYFHGKGVPLFMYFQDLNYCFRVFDPGKEFQLKGRYTCLVRVNFYHDIRGCVLTEESIISDSSKLYEFFKQCDILWAILILQQVYSSTGIWSSQLITLFKLQDGIQGLQVFSHLMILLVVESDGKLLRKSMQETMGHGLLFLKTLEVAGIFVCLKRGYRGVGCSERRMETKEILNQASAIKINRLGGLEEKIKEVMLGIFIEAEDAAQLFSITLMGSLTIAMRTICGEDFIIRLQLKYCLTNNRGAPCAGSVHVKKQETISILNYFERGILSLVSSRQCFHCHNRVFFWTGICEWRVEIIHSRSMETNGIVCGDNGWYDLARDCRLLPSLSWQQLLLTVGGRNLDRYVVLASKYFLQNFHQLLKQLKLSTTDGATVQGK